MNEAARAPARQHEQPYTHPRLQALVAAARERGSAPGALARVALAYPCDALAVQAAAAVAAAGIARPLLVGPREAIVRAAGAAAVELGALEVVETADSPGEAAAQSVKLARQGVVAALMKGSLHTDELLAAVAKRHDGLHGESRITHAFVFDLPRYHKLIALADCVVNIVPNVRTKHDIVGNAVALLRVLGVAEPKVAVVAAVETVNPAIPATLDAQALVASAQAGRFGNAVVEGPLGFDNAFSAEAARIKGIRSSVAGDVDLLLMPDLNAGNLLYKSFVYVGGGECAGLVLGTRVPVVLTSRADSLLARLASVALAVLTVPR